MTVSQSPAGRDPGTQAWLDQEAARLTATIRQRGHSVEYVIGTAAKERPDFAYTIGMFGLGHPELLVFGLDPGGSCNVLNSLADRIRAGTDLLPREVVELAGSSHRLIVESVPNPGRIVFAANWFYARPGDYSVPVYQLTYDDCSGRFPWDADYGLPAWVQPRPGEFAA